MQAQVSMIALMVFSLCVSSCRQSSEAEASPTKTANKADLNAPVAIVGDTTITLGEFQDQINRQSPYVRARYTTIEQKKEFLNNLIRFEVLAKEARAKGYDKNPDVVRAMKQVMIQKLMKSKFEKTFSPEDVSDADIKRFYEANPEDFNKPEEVRVSAIVVKGQRSANEVAALAKGPKGSTNNGFRELVDLYSADEDTKLRGGDLRYFASDNDEIPKAVRRAGFAMTSIGDVSGPIKVSKNLYYVIKQTGHRGAIKKELETVKRQIQNQLFRKKRSKAQKDFIEELRSKSDIKVFDKALSKIKIAPDTTSSIPAPSPNLPAFSPKENSSTPSPETP